MRGNAVNKNDKKKKKNNKTTEYPSKWRVSNFSNVLAITRNILYGWFTREINLIFIGIETSSVIRTCYTDNDPLFHPLIIPSYMPRKIDFAVSFIIEFSIWFFEKDSTKEIIYSLDHFPLAGHATISLHEVLLTTEDGQAHE